MRATTGKPAGLSANNLGTGTRLADPEESTVYEIGLKVRFEMGALNLAIFDQTIKGFQSNIFIGFVMNFYNFPQRLLEVSLLYSHSLLVVQQT